MADDNPDAMLREAARARGFRLVKSRRRKPDGDFGKYGLTDLKTGRECLGFGSDGLTATADEVRAYLRGGEVASWKRSLIGVVPDAAKETSGPSRPARPEQSPKTSKPQKKEGTPRSSAKSRRGAKANRSSRAQQDSHSAVAGGAGGSKSPAECSIRPATRRDAAAIAKLIDADAPALAERLAAAIRDGDAPLVAERDGIVGAIAWTAIAMLAEPPRGRITLLHVAEDSRRQGIGTRLLDEAESQLAEAGIDRIEMLLDIELDAPSAFLRRTGWKRSANGYAKAP